MSDSLKNSLFQYLKKNAHKWVNGGELERYSDELGYKPSNGARQARKLVGLKVERREVPTKDGRRCVEYRYIESHYERMNRNYQNQGTLKLI